MCLILSANGTKQPLARQVSGFMTAGGKKKKNHKEEKAIANNEMAPLEASGRELIKL